MQEDPSIRIRMIEAITSRILQRSEVGKPDFAKEIARRWATK